MPSDNTARQQEEPSVSIQDSKDGRQNQNQDSASSEVVTYSEIQPKSHKGRGILAGILSSVFVLSVIGVCGYETYTLKQQRDSLNQEAQELEQQLQEGKADVLQNEIDNTYYASDKYKEDLARNHFRLIYPGEYLIEIVD